jgi:uncharacterized protein YbjT (DUF2867 family)
MRFLIFGATGMLGQGALRECLLDPEIEEVQTVGRSATGVRSSKLRDSVQPDMFHYSGIEAELRGFDACFFCLGVSSVGVFEQQYENLTYSLTLAAAETLARLNPSISFVYVSGAGTDSSEKGRANWARVKGKTESVILRLPFKAAYMFRPGIILRPHGARSKTTAYRVGYALTKPVIPLLRRFFPRYVLTTEEIGRAMLNVAKRGSPKKILKSWDIGDCATTSPTSPSTAT